jgi:SAM-dependent methyltransferase
MGEQARFDCLTGRANYISRLSILNEFIKGAPIQNITARPTRLFLTNILNLSVREVMMFKHRDILGFGKSVIKRIIKKALFITKSTPSPLKPYFIHNQESRRSEFEKIYSESIWGNGSGNGSSLEACVPYMEFLSKFIKDNYIETVVDAGCGDWQFSQHFDWGNVNYLGLDTVRNVIEANRAKYESENIKFAVVDLVDGNLPPSDLLIVKDVLQHLSNESINKIISKFQNYKYVLVVNDIYDSKWLNAQISDGDYRPLDLKLPPFKLSCIKVFEWNASGDPKVVYQFLRN